jgi:hypothetical protein
MISARFTGFLPGPARIDEAAAPSMELHPGLKQVKVLCLFTHPVKTGSGGQHQASP